MSTPKTDKQKKKCEHLNFRSDCKIARLEDSGGFMAEIVISCLECFEPFKFLGLPMGLNLQGATTDPTQTELNIAIAPLSEQERDRYKIMTGLSSKESN